ncbi:MAG: hypothetical protein ACI88G_000170 [Woeseiaceae bacterium]|jgi:hypothetical protein
MTETATHKTAGQDQSLTIINALAMLDLNGLSFVQLKRLHKALQHASEDVAKESERRADSDMSGDTVRVPSPKL